MMFSKFYVKVSMTCQYVLLSTLKFELKIEKKLKVVMGVVLYIQPNRLENIRDQST